ncbi:MAG: transcription elongation factor GreB [Myxococcales bacterium]|nr:transcription elongation factor GreB [Myxococcales bacterium]
MNRPITPEGYRKLERELQTLWHEDRPRVVREVSDAAAHGDRSENAEYIFGKKKLREIDRRIKFLSELLDKVTVVHPGQAAAGVVDFGATVSVRDEEGSERTYTLVGEDEVEPKLGRISTKSPVGKALLNRRVGDVFVVRRPAGEIELEVVRIDYA